MSAESELRAVVIELCQRAAEAWATGRPLLADRYFDGAITLLGSVDLIDHEDAER